MQVAFLYNGRYLSVPHRLAGLHLVAENPNAPRDVSFEYLNQQLVWGELQNFVIFLLPLLTPRAVASMPLVARTVASIRHVLSRAGVAPPHLHQCSTNVVVYTVHCSCPPMQLFMGVCRPGRNHTGWMLQLEAATQVFEAGKTLQPPAATFVPSAVPAPFLRQLRWTAVRLDAATCVHRCTGSAR